MKRRLLVVDNEIDICNFVKLFFETRGFQVFTALNGDEALQGDAAGAPEIILLDVRMRSEFEGLDFLPRLRQSYPRARVILVSGLDDP
ncbi:MAG: response regulator, partial [Candidatus Omnitrophota bacterium]